MPPNVAEKCVRARVCVCGGYSTTSRQSNRRSPPSTSRRHQQTCELTVYYTVATLPDRRLLLTFSNETPKRSRDETTKPQTFRQSVVEWSSGSSWGGSSLTLRGVSWRARSYPPLGELANRLRSVGVRNERQNVAKLLVLWRQRTYSWADLRFFGIFSLRYSRSLALSFSLSLSVSRSVLRFRS